MKSSHFELSTYLKVYVALVLLLGLSVWAARFDLGAVSPILALLIAGAKSFLVLVYFMHLKETPWLRPVMWALLIFLGVVGTLTISDYLTRQG